MIIKIAQPIGFTQIGKRSKNEDAIFPVIGSSTIETSLFLVCDGMGGHSNGEIASNITTKRFANYFENHLYSCKNKDEIKNYWDIALYEIEEEFEEYILQNPDSKGMGTTLSLLHFHENGITAGHIGDSRIYQIRGNQVVFMTEDHSMVNELLKSGQITAIEALNYPNKNVITRAIQGLSMPTKIEYDFIEDIQVGDYFFLCTDGVLEKINDRILIDILTYDGVSLVEKCNIILEKCLNLTNDNYSGYLIEVTNIENNSISPEYILNDGHSADYSLVRNPEEDILSVELTQHAIPGPQIKPKSLFFRRTKDVLMGLLYAFGGLVIFFIIFIGLDYFKSDSQESKASQKVFKTSLELPTPILDKPLPPKPNDVKSTQKKSNFLKKTEKLPKSEVRKDDTTNKNKSITIPVDFNKPKKNSRDSTRGQ